MNMTLLGTAGGDWMHQQRHDSADDVCCDGKNLRYPAMAFLAPDTLIDFSAEGAWQLGRAGVQRRQIRHLLITHSHFDHFDAPSIIRHFLMNQHGPAEGPTIYAGDRTMDRFEAAAASCDFYEGASVVERFPRVRLEVHTRYAVGGTTVIPVHAAHMHLSADEKFGGETALNFIFQREGKSILYATDSTTFRPETVEFLKAFRFDAMIVDASYGEVEVDPAATGHMTFAMLRAQLDQLRDAGVVDADTRIVCTHISVCAVQDHDRAAEAVAGDGVLIGYDGMTVET